MWQVAPEQTLDEAYHCWSRVEALPVPIQMPYQRASRSACQVKVGLRLVMFPLGAVWVMAPGRIVTLKKCCVQGPPPAMLKPPTHHS